MNRPQFCTLTCCRCRPQPPLSLPAHTWPRLHRSRIPVELAKLAMTVPPSAPQGLGRQEEPPGGATGRQGEPHASSDAQADHSGPSRMTAEELAAWLQRREQPPTAEAAAAAAAARRQDIAAGRVPPEALTGKELWEHHPEVFDGF